MNSLNLTRLFDISFSFSLVWLLSVKEIFIFNEELLILGCFLIFSSLSFYSSKQIVLVNLDAKVNQFKEVFSFYINQTKLTQEQRQIELVKNSSLQNEMKKLPNFFMDKIQNLREVYRIFLNNLFVTYVNEIYYRLFNVKKQKNVENQVGYLNFVILKNLCIKLEKDEAKRFIQSF